jgi:diaminopimelate epimerase
MSDPKDFEAEVEVFVVGAHVRGSYIDSGVPHIVVPVPAIDDINVRELGSAIRHHERFAPRGANVNFLEERSPGSIAIRTYERGVEDETLACGTGVVASALTFAAAGNLDGPIRVLVRGGDEMTVEFQREGERFTNVMLSGPADFVFEGTVEV